MARRVAKGENGKKKGSRPFPQVFFPLVFKVVGDGRFELPTSTV